MIHRRAALALVGAAALLVTAAPGLVAGPAAEAAASCTPAPIAVAVGMTLSCTIAGAPVNPDDPAPGTRSYSVAIDLDAPGVVPRAVMANDVVFQPVTADVDTPSATVDEVVSSMADRTGAAIGINGGYFDIYQGGGGKPYTGAICGGAVLDGEIWKSPPTGPDAAELDTALTVAGDGTMAIGHVGFAGSVTVLSGGAPLASQPLAAVNDITAALPVPRCPVAFLTQPSDGAGISLLTPRLGPVLLNPGPGASPGYTVPSTGPQARAVTLVTATPLGGGLYTVDAVTTTQGVSSLAAVPAGAVALLGSGSDATSGGGWLAANLSAGTTITLDQGLTVDGLPAGGIRTLVGGVAQVVDGGAVVADPVGFVPANVGAGDLHAETLVGLDDTGRQVTVTVIDRSDGSPGVWWQQAAQVMVDQGVQEAILLDGGGSSTLVARLGAAGTPVTVVNTPEGDNVLNGPFLQRYVGDGLVFLGDPVPAPVPVLPVTGGDGGAVAAAAGAVLVVLGLVLRARGRRPAPTG